MKFTFKPFKGDTKSPEAGGMLDFALKNYGLSIAPPQPLTPMSEESSDNPRAKRKEQIRRAQKYV
jgi:hypothetical protein